MTEIVVMKSENLKNLRLKQKILHSKKVYINTVRLRGDDLWYEPTKRNILRGTYRRKRY